MFVCIMRFFLISQQIRMGKRYWHYSNGDDPNNQDAVNNAIFDVNEDE